jgi:hypothetical protein
MNKSPYLAAAAVALLSLAACEHKPEEVDNKAPDPIAEQIKNAAPAAEVPTIAASVTFRCQPGNTLVYVDFFRGDKMVTIKETKEGFPKALKAPEAGQPYVGDGSWKVTGTAKAATIVLGDGSTHTCKS